MKTYPSRRFLRAAVRPLLSGFAALCGLSCLALAAHADTAMKRLPGHVPALVAQANLAGSVARQETISLALTLPLRNEAQANALLQRLYDPNDPLYGQYLTTAQFTAQFAPTQADYDAVIAFARAQGLTVTTMHPNRLILDVTGTAQTVQAAFGVKLKQYRLPEGRVFHAPTADPVVPASIAKRLQAVIGLDNSVVMRSFHHARPADPLAFLQADNATPSGFNPPAYQPFVTGSASNGGMTPSDIKTAYNLNNTTLSGSGQTLALLELDGYKASDITAYENYFSLPRVPLQNVLVDGVSGAEETQSGPFEVTMDIELQVALAPGASKILVYEGPNNTVGAVDTYNHIANDNLAKSISTSWGVPEQQSSANVYNIENNIFLQMALQGQSIFAAAGDDGAYTDGRTLCVGDPASQPLVTGVGGTRLTTNGPGGAWLKETTWMGKEKAPFDSTNNDGGGGGGKSAGWPLPFYQSGVISRASGGSTTMRNVPDVSLNADGANSGYAIIYSAPQHGPGLWLAGGTSAAAPLWSAFAALVNQQRVNMGKCLLGFANPALYAIGKSANYARDFHDIADGSNNLYYPAVTGYDLATGWGSFNGLNLLSDLSGINIGPVETGQLLGNPGFENGASNPSPWTVTPGVIDNSSAVPAHGGAWKAWLNGYGKVNTDYIAQQVTIPYNCSKATLSFYLRVLSSETTQVSANDTLQVIVADANGNLLGTLATYSNLNKSSAYSQKTFDLSVLKGRTIQLWLIGKENGSLPTSFLLDDFSLIAQ